MPPYRHPQTARLHALRNPYKVSIIVISSDEDEEPVSVPKRGSRKHRRSRAESEVHEISEDTSVKVDETEFDLRRRCHELEEKYKTLRNDKRHLSATVSRLDDITCCHVCKDTMWSPYILSCGHTFCEDCLTKWFEKILADHRQIGKPPYSCPLCRALARTPPAPNFALKGFARLAAEFHGGSSPRKAQAASLPPMPSTSGHGSRLPGPFDHFFSHFL
ncbi:hypothetical protein BJV77DRAFT_755574 [Russula vinacea]|nr:hypothetical protein BJV77DRAFT_755574 [Russula vinacea]